MFFFVRGRGAGGKRGLCAYVVKGFWECLLFVLFFVCCFCCCCCCCCCCCFVFCCFLLFLVVVLEVFRGRGRCMLMNVLICVIELC